MASLTDMTGKRCGRLSVVRYLGTVKRRGFWLCRCDCGTEAKVQSSHLQRGHTRSCGCLKDDTLRERATKHGCTIGGRHTDEYKTWTGIITRCTNPNCDEFRLYGGRGIGICDRWRKSFAAFLADMGSKPSPKHSIDRIDNDEGYEPGNCRWATREEQALNRRQTVHLTYRGRTQPLKKWAQELGFNYHTLHNRIHNYGWSVERALNEPVKQMRRRKAARAKEAVS